MATEDGRTTPSRATREEDQRDAGAEHRADRQPTPEESSIADELAPDPETVEHEREMAERGAHQKGEGRLP